MSRIVTAGAVVRDQLDFYSSGITRASGVTLATLSCVIFYNNTNLGWTLADGTLVSDINVAAGTIYFNEIAGSPSYYTVRFYPDRTGFWRLIFTNLAPSAQPILEFDVIVAQPGPSGLNASFLR